MHIAAPPLFFPRSFSWLLNLHYVYHYSLCDNKQFRSIAVTTRGGFGQARFALGSGGKRTPCRIGTARGVEVVDRIIKDDHRAANIEVLEDLCNTMKFGSLCAFGGFTLYPVFPEDFGAQPRFMNAPRRRPHSGASTSHFGANQDGLYPRMLAACFSTYRARPSVCSRERRSAFSVSRRSSASMMAR